MEQSTEQIDPIESLTKECKLIQDIIHGSIGLTQFAVLIIDTPQFQRLHELKQLGTCYLVFPNAKHSRFEHSIGTYHLAGQILKTIATTTDPRDIGSYLESITELKKYYTKTYRDSVHILDDYIIELIKIAALCHDIGHGPFSHLFDDVFLPIVGKKDQYCSLHEERSAVLLEHIIKNNSFLASIINDDEIQFMKNLINPDPQIHKGFVYQIVSNCLTGLDVDKFDYLARDVTMTKFEAKIDPTRLVKNIRILYSEDETTKIKYPNIAYAVQVVDDIINLFTTRYRMHKNVYSHKVVIIIQQMIIDMMLLLDDILDISDSITDVDKFCNLTDSYILDGIKFIKTKYLTPDQHQRYTQAKKIYDSLQKRELYATIDVRTIDTKVDVDKLSCEIITQCNIAKDQLIIFQSKIGYVSGNKKNPLDSVLLYNTKDPTKTCKNRNSTTMLPKNHQEYILMVFYKRKHETNTVDVLRKFCESIDISTYFIRSYSQNIHNSHQDSTNYQPVIFLSQ